MKAIFVTFFLVVATREVVGMKNWTNSKDDQNFKGDVFDGNTKVYIRLKGSHLSYAGRVEISKDGKVWGTICDKDWNLHDARVICTQLNFSYEVAAVPMAGFGAGSGAIFLKDVACEGSERSLLQCEHDGWKSHYVNESCDHSMDVGVLCSPPKQMISFIVIIVLSCALAASYLLNIWFTYYVYCKTKRRRKRHLTAVQQKALTRKNISQNGLDNLALDSERGENLSTSVDEVLGQDVIYRSWSGRVRSEDTPVSNAASQQGEDQHVYQRLQSCVFDPLSQDYLEIPESVGHRQTNQPEMRGSVKSPKRPSYKFVPPHLPVAAESKKDNKSGQEENHLYEKLLLRNGFPDEAQASSAEQDLKETSNSALRTSIPDYVEIISDDVLAANTKKLQSTTPTSQETSAIVDNAYEIPITVPALYKESKASTCAVHKENYESTRGEDTEEADYMELLNENKASKKDNTIANKENT